MKVDPRAGTLLPEADLVDLAKLEQAYYSERPDPSNPGERVVFGTSGHRGSSLHRSFNEDHIAATTAAICDWREANGVDGPLFLGMDTHALSVPAHTTALEVLAARGVKSLVAPRGAFTPTPAVSRAIIAHNKGAGGPRADGIVVTPSHNPPEYGGFKYDPPHGGPAEGAVTSWIESRANELLAAGGARSVARLSLERAAGAGLVREYDFLGRYVDDLDRVLDLEAVARAKPRLAVDPLGGAAVAYWDRIAERYGIAIVVLNRAVDKTFRFVPADHDGKIRTDCSSPFTMAKVLAHKDSFDVALACDADADRHGVVTATGLLPPNHYLSAAVDYLIRHRPKWPSTSAIGKTAVTSDMLDRVAQSLVRPIEEVPVGFKWFVAGLDRGALAFGGEESAGGSFLSRDGSTWTTDKDGILLGLLAAEIVAVTGQDPGKRYESLERSVGKSYYERRDAPATPSLADRLRRMSPEDWASPTLAGDPLTSRRVVSSTGAPLGGLKVTTSHSWFVVRPSGTEDVYKLYAESFRSAEHLAQVIAEAADLVERLS